MWFHRLAKRVLRLVIPLLLDVRVEGLHHVPRQGPLIVAINHTNFWDGVLATAYLPRDVVGLAKVELFRVPLLGLILRWYRAVPVHRGEVDRHVLGKAVEALQQGRVVSMAPEGTRSKDHRLQRGRDGMAFLAARTGAPVLPMAISGSELFWSQVVRFRRTPTRIVIGQPFRFTVRGEVEREMLRRMTQEGMYRLAALLPEGYRGYYSDLSQATRELIEPYRSADQKEAA